MSDWAYRKTRLKYIHIDVHFCRGLMFPELFFDVVVKLTLTHFITPPSTPYSPPNLFGFEGLREGGGSTSYQLYHSCAGAPFSSLLTFSPNLSLLSYLWRKVSQVSLEGQVSDQILESFTRWASFTK